MHELIELFEEDGKIFIRVRFKGYDIQKWYSPDEPSHIDEIAILKSGNKQAINQIVESLGNELITSLKHPDIDILDENNEVKIKIQPIKTGKVNLLAKKEKEEKDGK